MGLKMTVILRPAQRDDIIAFRGEPYNDSFRGIVVEEDGDILGIAGVMHTPVLQAFSSITDRMKKYPKMMVRAMREFRKILRKYDGSTVYALANENEKTAPGFLEHVGFKHYQNEVYRWEIQ